MPRTLRTDDVVERLWRSWTTRHETEATLARRLPAVYAQAEAQMDEILVACVDTRRSSAGLRRAA